MTVSIPRYQQVARQLGEQLRLGVLFMNQLFQRVMQDPSTSSESVPSV